MLDDFRNCPVCGAIYLHKSRNLCPKCVAVEEKDYEKVRKYVNSHPKATISEVAEQTEVNEETILNFLKEGRLSSKGFTASSSLKCQFCGTTIASGTYCEDCRNSLNQQFSTPKPKITKTDQTMASNSRKMFTQERK